MMRVIVLAFSHVAMLVAGFALGIYLLPIITAPDGPDAELLRSLAVSARYTGEFRRELEDSDLLHWAEGTLYVDAATIAFEGELAPGPDYRLYLSPEFVETEADFMALKDQMVEVGAVRSFNDFSLAVPASVDPEDYRAAIVWCESFGQFISAAAYR